jgi:hypothetical protein
MSRPVVAIVALQVALLASLPVGSAVATEVDDPQGHAAEACLVAAANTYRLPAASLLILLNVEGGRLGAVSQNRDGSVDIGPMQVNNRWVPKIAGHWHAEARAAYVALRDNLCANLEAGAWILRTYVDEAGGDFWEGVGRYHSHLPAYKMDYLRKVLGVTRRLAAQAAGHTG